MRCTDGGDASPDFLPPGIIFSITPWAKLWKKHESQNKKRHPGWGALFYLAAGAIAAVAAVVAAATAVQAIVVAAAAAAEQHDQNDNPPNTATTEAVTVTHNRYLRNS